MMRKRLTTSNAVTVLVTLCWSELTIVWWKCHPGLLEFYQIYNVELFITPTKKMT